MIEPERLVKSGDRVRDLGEVFTPSATVDVMLDLLPEEMWLVHPSKTFFEPACGDGNFLVAVLERKLARVTKGFENGILPAGTTADAAQLHALEALAAIYGVDISRENIIGGVPGHEMGARSRLVAVFLDWNRDVLSLRLLARSPILRAATWVVDHNVIVGNMLAFDAEGRATGRDHIPLIEYLFDPTSGEVELRQTTVGDVIAVEEAKSTSTPSLFAPREPSLLWRGRARDLADTERVEAPKLRGPARNGVRRR